MLIRRFTIVCLITVLFGMSLSVLVAETSRSTYKQPIPSPLTALKQPLR